MCQALDLIEARGEAIGEARGKLILLWELVKDKVLTKEDAAKRNGTSVEEFIRNVQQIMPIENE